MNCTARATKKADKYFRRPASQFPFVMQSVEQEVTEETENACPSPECPSAGQSRGKRRRRVRNSVWSSIIIRVMAPRFVRPNVREMEGYVPGEQPEAGQRIVKLNTNENPYPPSERVMQAIADASAESLRRYPNPRADLFRDAAAKVHGLSRENIIAGNGSDDLLTIATRCFVSEGGTLAYPDPTYSLYPVLARLQDAKGVAVPWESE